MNVPDVNVLLYAHLALYPHHPRARAWWEQVLGSGEPVGLALPVVFGFVRIATNPRVFDPPMALEAALDTVRGWLERPGVRLLYPGPEHMEIALGLLAQAGTAANLTTDAQIAALAIEHQATVCSNDTDFARFQGLRRKDPLA